MSIKSQVDFIERVSKSILGLEGLQIVVYCDKTKNEILTEQEKAECNFLEIGNKLISTIDGKYIKEKYNIENGIEFGNKLHQERINYLKNIIK